MKDKESDSLVVFQSLTFLSLTSKVRSFFPRLDKLIQQVNSKISLGIIKSINANFAFLINRAMTQQDKGENLANEGTGEQDHQSA